jgi:hypothetical protein
MTGRGTAIEAVAVSDGDVAARVRLPSTLGEKEREGDGDPLTSPLAEAVCAESVSDLLTVACERDARALLLALKDPVSESQVSDPLREREARALLLADPVSWESDAVSVAVARLTGDRVRDSVVQRRRT